jgi:hypothetical protein
VTTKPPDHQADDPAPAAPRAGDRVRVETTGRVVEVPDAGGLTGVRVELDTSGEAWLPVEALTVLPHDPDAADEPVSLTRRRVARRRPARENQ